MEERKEMTLPQDERPDALGVAAPEAPVAASDPTPEAAPASDGMPTEQGASRFSRRTLLAGLGVAGLAAAAGSGVLWAVRSRSQAPARPAISPGSVPTPPVGGTYPSPVTEAQRLEQALDVYLEQMSLDDKLGQMIQAQFVASKAGGHQLTIPADWQAELRRVRVGSAILYWYNIETASQLKAFTSSLQAPDVAPDIPLLICIDEEGGEVDYLWWLYGGGPSEASLGASGNPQNAYNWGKLNGKHMAAMGFNSNLAPIIDVKTTPHPGLDQRMYGSDPTLVTNMASAFIDGLHTQGIMSCLKHWPGLGWATIDAHKSLPVSNRSLAELESIDFVPYKALLAAGPVDMIMPTHVLLTSIDPKMPSSLSPIIVNEMLRQQLGYQGVLITDALYMGAISATYSLAEAAVLAVIAGNDILSSFYTPADLERVLAALHQAIDAGRITQTRIDQSVKRILLLKMKYGLFTPPNFDG
jgi:beta-N-acetylhexosaminidase